jgi:hypothetical protein
MFLNNTKLIIFNKNVIILTIIHIPKFLNKFASPLYKPKLPLKYSLYPLGKIDLSGLLLY